MQYILVILDMVNHVKMFLSSFISIINIDFISFVII